MHYKEVSEITQSKYQKPIDKGKLMAKFKDQNAQTTYSTYFKAAFPYMNPTTTINANGQIEVRIDQQYHAEFVASMKNPQAKLIQTVPHFVPVKEYESAAATYETAVFGGFTPNTLSPTALNPSKNLINQVLKLADARYLNQLGFRLDDWDIKDIDRAHGTYTVKVDHIDSKTQATFEENIASANERFLTNFKVPEATMQARGSDYEASYQPARNAIIKISSSDKSTILKVNHEQIALATEKCDGLEPPSIAYNETTGVFLLHPKCVAAQAVTVFGGFIGAPTPDGDYTPVLFNVADAAMQTKSHFTFLADRSGSMSGIIDSVRTQIKSAIKYALRQGNEVDINVVGFNESDYMKAAFTQQSLEADIDGFVNGLQAGGGTNLYGALYNAIKSHEKDVALGYSASTIFLLSDGEHYASGSLIPTMTDVQRIIDTNKQAIVAISIGDIKFQTLDTITKQLGCPHLLAKTPSDIEHIKSYISSSSARFQIGDNIITTVLEMAKSLPSVTMKLGDQIIKDGKTGTLDIEPVTSHKADVVSAIYKAVHEKCLAIAKFAGSKFYTTSAAAGQVVQKISTLTDQALEQIELKLTPLTELEKTALQDYEAHHATSLPYEMSMGFETCQEATHFGEQLLLGHYDAPQLT